MRSYRKCMNSLPSITHSWKHCFFFFSLWSLEDLTQWFGGTCEAPFKSQVREEWSSFTEERPTGTRGVRKEGLVQVMKFVAHASWGSSSWGHCRITGAASLSQELSSGKPWPPLTETPGGCHWPCSFGPWEMGRGMGPASRCTFY